MKLLNFNTAILARSVNNKYFVKNLKIFFIFYLKKIREKKN
jgi:hypothetical protein